MAVDQHTLMRTLMGERVKLYAYIWSIVRDEHVAEDVWQEVSVLALDKRDSIEDAGALPTWLRRASRLKALEALRREVRTPALMDESMLDRLDHVWDRFDQDESTRRVQALRDCMGQLTENNRRIVRMRYADGMKGVDVAKALGRQTKAVYMALTRIHGQLGECVRSKLSGGSADA